ncbi:MAG: thiolase family protein [Betaproteobacteria bacterium]|nr:thiolase family protein [Betaproteobacteria bacterium]
MRASKVLEKTVAITGIGLSDVGRPSPSSPIALTIQACRRAIASAGIETRRIDGVSSWPGFVADGSGMAPVGAHEVQRALGLKLDWFCGARETPGQLGAIFNAAAAIATGLVNHVLVFRTIAEASARSQNRSSTSWGSRSERVQGVHEWTVPFGAVTPIQVAAMMAARHFHEFGSTREQLGQIAVTSRQHASLNPGAVFRDPFTIQDYLVARPISTPLCLLDCDVPVDISMALILSRIDESAGLAHPPIRIEAIGSAMHRTDTWWRPECLTDTCSSDAATMMWNRTDMKPGDVDLAELYDGYSIFTFLWLEALGFCGRGEAGSFVEGGHRIALDGQLPLNTHGGQLSAGRQHGLGTVVEACTQLWGEAGARQVANSPRIAAVSAGFANGFSGCMLLTRDN